MVYWLIFIVIVLVTAVVLFYISKAGKLQKQLEQIRYQWGKTEASPRDFRLIGSLLQSGSTTSETNQASAHDLDLNKVFAYVDHTSSKPGQQYLYERLHKPSTSVDELNALESRLQTLTSDTALREAVQLQLKKLNSHDAYYLPELFTRSHASPFSRLQEFYIRCSAIFVITLTILLVLTQSQVYFLTLLAAVIANVCLHMISKQKVSHYTVSLPQLLNLYEVARWLEKQKPVAIPDELQAGLNRMAKLKSSLSFVSIQSTIAKDPSDLSYGIIELIKIIFLVEPLLFLISINRINRYRADIEAAFRFVGNIDMLISIASLRAGLPSYCLPVFATAGNTLNVQELYHPLIENCVANSITLKAAQGILITGSNMSGKTTFIRALALNSLLAQTLHTCCAKVYESPVLNIFTSIHMSDNLEAQQSYFQAEALSVLNIIKQSAAARPVQSLVIIDEIFRGTNTLERIAAAKAVLSYLSRHHCFVLVSTHDLELAELLGHEYAVYSFEETVTDKRLVFDYKIKPGLLKHKNGIAILQGLGYPESIVQDAYEVNELMKDKYKL